MFALTDPYKAYQRSQFDARVQGSDTAALVQLCLEQAIAGLGGAVLAHEKADFASRSKALTRALTAITALEMGVDRAAPLASALLSVYGAARRAVLGCVTDFDCEVLVSSRQDLADIKAALDAAAR